MNLFSQAQNGYDFLVNMIIRPPRSLYSVNNLGPQKFKINGHVIERRDSEVINERGLKIQYSHFIEIPQKRQPCVVYLHGNCGSRVEALNLVNLFIPENISFMCFDFSGSGLSDGEYISLGFYERDDVKTIVNHLRQSPYVSSIGLWGRSMGAATAIMYAATDPTIAGVVLDSPFSSLTKLAEELVSTFGSIELPMNIPKIAIQLGLKMIRKSVQSKANFDIEKLEPVEYVNSCFIPALFAHGKEDDFIRPSHCELLYELYAGDRNIIMMEGDHNSERPSFFHDSVLIFFLNTLFNNHDQLEDNNPVTEDENYQIGRFIGLSDEGNEDVI